MWHSVLIDVVRVSFTSKFRYPEHCRQFAQNVLGYSPNETDDYYAEIFDDWTYFDDYYGDDEAAEGPCCAPYEVEQGCPYEVCAHYTNSAEANNDEGGGGGSGGNDDGQGGGGGMIGRRALAGEQEQPAPAVKWWEKSQLGGRKSRRDRSAHAREEARTHAPDMGAAAGEAVADTQHAPTSATATTATEPSSAAALIDHPSAQVTASEATGPDPLELDWYREYAFSQVRNSVCVYDEKYGLWVRTSCHGKVGKMVYFLFADRHCQKAIKRVVHDIYDIMPQYGECVKVRSFAKRHEQGDHRMSLTVCHNNRGEDGEDIPPPMVS
jgi:hypothetical protein